MAPLDSAICVIPCTSFEKSSCLTIVIGVDSLANGLKLDLVPTRNRKVLFDVDTEFARVYVYINTLGGIGYLYHHLY